MWNFNSVSIYCLILIYSVNCFNIDTENIIIYSFPNFSKRSTYFGFSVALRPQASHYSDSSWVIQIGAPRGNDSLLEVSEPGTVFRCKLSGPCENVSFERTGNKFQYKRGRGRSQYHVFAERLDYSWLGVSMDAARTELGDVIVSCGHQWVYQAISRPFGLDHDNYLAVGSCYFEFLNETSRQVHQLVPLKNEERAYMRHKTGSVIYDWGLGLAGMSVKITPSTLNIGAPCVYHWTGSVVRYSLNDLNKPQVGEVAWNQAMSSEQYTYTSYGLDIGKFFGNNVEWLAMGSPKYGSLHGQVFITSLKREKTGISTFYVHSTVKGTQIGEYFGAAVAVADINKDGFDDLFVGAPMHSKRFVDQGKVYIFLGGRKRLEPHLESASILEGTSEYSRFGTSIAVGDFDQDGWPDVIIGAPYENNYRGAIYLYRFSRSRASPILSQKINAIEIHDPLRGFGSTFSRPVDCDGDNYPDIAVGSYLSEQVVLLRSRPVVSFKINITNIPKFLNRKNPHFNFTACVSYVGNHPPTELDAVIALDIDKEMGRGYFKQTNSTSMTFLTAMLQATSPLCFVADVRFNIIDLNNTYHIPVKLSGECFINKEIPVKRIIWDEEMDIVEVLPIVNVQSQERYVKELLFAGECGTDNICQSDLNLECSFVDLDSVFYLGSKDEVKLELKLYNKGEPALQSSIVLNPKDVPGLSDFESMNLNCVTDSKCLYNMGTISEQGHKSVIFHINTDEWKHLTNPLIHMNFSVVTTSDDRALGNKFCSLTLNIKVSTTKVYLYSTTSSLSLFLPSPIQDNAVSNFIHTYEIQKLGNAPIKQITLQVCIPTKLSIEEGVFNLTNISFLQQLPNIEESDIDWTALQENGAQRFLSRFELDTENTPISNKTFFINCSTPNVEFTLVSYVVSKIPFKLDLELSLNNSHIDGLFTDHDIVRFSTNATIYVTHYLNKRSEISSTATSTCLIKEISGKAISLHIVLLSVIAGGLLIAILIPVLIKEGFFRRETKDRLEALKTQDLIEERFSISEPRHVLEEHKAN